MRLSVVSKGWAPIQIQLFSSTAQWKLFSKEDIFSSLCDYPSTPKGEKLSYFLTGKVILMVLLTVKQQWWFKCYLRLRCIFDSVKLKWPNFPDGVSKSWNLIHFKRPQGCSDNWKEHNSLGTCSSGEVTNASSKSRFSGENNNCFSLSEHRQYRKGL